MDFKKLKQIQDDLITQTENSTTEILERIYTKLMECVSHYKGVYNRENLPKKMELQSSADRYEKLLKNIID